jgi:PST family polysaccharide transporter
MRDLKRVATQGIVWNIVATLGKQLLAFLIGVIMARLLSPREFGLVGMAVVFVGFLNLFVDQGLGSAIIQRQNLTDLHLDSIFWLNVGVGASLTLVLYLLSGAIARFFHEPVLQPMMFLISLNFFIGSLGVVQSALIDKQVAFKKHAIINTVSSVVSGLVGIGLALKGYGVWSLAWR